MPNAEGRAATKRAPRKSTAAAAPAAEPKAERHVRSPLERAQGVYDKAKAASDKIVARLVAAKAEVTALEAEQQEAKVTLDWAASHPLLVKARKEAEGETQAAVTETLAEGGRDDDYTDGAVDADAAPTDAAAEEGEPTGEPESAPAAGEPESTPAADVFEQGDEEEQPAAAAPPFPFDAPPEVPAQSNGFDFDAGRTTHVS